MIKILVAFLAAARWHLLYLYLLYPTKHPEYIDPSENTTLGLAGDLAR